MTFLEWLFGLLQVILGFLLGSILTGLFTVYFVIPKVMRNKDIQELLKLFREGKSYLHEILENQKRKEVKSLAGEEEEKTAEEEKEEGAEEGEGEE